MKKLQAIRENVFLTPHANTYMGSLIVPESYSNRTSLCMIESVGADCPSFMRPGAHVLVPAHLTERKDLRVTGWPFFACSYKKIFAMVIHGKVLPLNRKLLVRRIIEEQKQGDIVIPACIRTTDQSLGVVVEELGSDFDVMDRPVRKGDLCRLAGWNESMIEVTLHGSYPGFYLIVDFDDLLCKIEAT